MAISPDLHEGAVHCPDCQSRDPARIGSLPDVRCFAGNALPEPLAGGALFECRCCALKFRYPAVDLGHSDALYNNGSVSAWSIALRSDQRIVLDWLSQSPGSREVLDFGCYTGQFLANLPERFARFGVEISVQAAEAARRGAGARIWKDLGSIEAGRSFDTIVCMDVVEHFQSPRELVAALLDRLRPGGQLLLTTGDADALLWRRFGARWWYCGYAEHIAFISARWLRHHCGPLEARVVNCEAFNYKDEGLVIKAIRWAALGAALAVSATSDVLADLSGRSVRSRRLSARRALPGVGLSRDHLFIVLQKPVASSGGD